MPFESQPNNTGPEEGVVGGEKGEETAPREQEQVEREINGKLDQAETTAREVEDLLREEISDAKKEVARKKLTHIGNIIGTAVGGGTAIAVMWGGAGVSMVEKLGLGGETVRELMDSMNKPEVLNIALAGAVVGLIGALRMAFSSVNLDVAQNKLEGLKDLDL